MLKREFKDGISVIVTVFNKEKFIVQTLESAINQFNKKENYQLIIIDDGSNDNSFKLIKNTLQQYNVDSKVIKQTNSGPSKATNKGLAFAKYSFIKLLDGDDILAPDSLSYMKTQMIEKNIDLLYGHWVWAKNIHEYEFKDNSPQSTIMQNPLEKFILRGWGGASNLMIRNKAMQKVGGCDQKVFIQDFSLPLRVAGNHLKKKESKKFKIGITSKIICVGPSVLENRIISNSSQTLYDLSVACINFIEEHPRLNKKLKNKALKKIISRCWSWRRKKLKSFFFDRFFLTYLKSKFNFGLNEKKIKYFIYQTWEDDQNVRKINLRNNTKLKILIYVGLDLLGDALLKIPMLKVLKLIFPNSQITWLAGKGRSEFKRSLKPLSQNLIDEFLDDSNFGSNFLDFLRIPSRKKFDIVIDTQKRLLTTILLKKIKTDLFISPCANFFLSDLFPKNMNEGNLSQYLVNLVATLSPKEVIFRNQTNNKSKQVAICPGASVIWKRWSLENFIEVSEYLVRNKSTPVFILGPKESNFHRHLAREFGGKIKIYRSDDPIYTIQIVKKCKFGISNDTGCGHLLAYTGIPIITIFGPTDSKKFAPIGNKYNMSVSSNEIFKSSDINSIPPNLVIEKVKKLLSI